MNWGAALILGGSIVVSTAVYSGVNYLISTSRSPVTIASKVAADATNPIDKPVHVDVCLNQVNFHSEPDARFAVFMWADTFNSHAIQRLGSRRYLAFRHDGIFLLANSKELREADLTPQDMAAYQSILTAIRETTYHRNVVGIDFQPLSGYVTNIKVFQDSDGLLWNENCRLPSPVGNR